MAGSVNKVILVGNLGKDPEVRNAQNGTKIVNFTLATSETWNDKASGERKERTEWHRVVAWRKLGEIAGEYLSKGKQVYIEGQLQTRSWDDQNGVKRYTTEINAREMIMLGGKGDSAGSRPPHPADTYAPQASSPAAAPTHTGKVSESPAMPPIQDMPPDDIPF